MGDVIGIGHSVEELHHLGDVTCGHRGGGGSRVDFQEQSLARKHRERAEEHYQPIHVGNY